MAVSRVTSPVRVLAGRLVRLPLLDVVLLEVYEWAVENGAKVKDLSTQPDVCQALIATELVRKDEKHTIFALPNSTTV
jgi:hypothetical protein